MTQANSQPPQYAPIALTDDATVVAEFVADPEGAGSYQSEAQLEALNDVAFTDPEWQRFLTEKIAGANDGIVEKTRRIQTDHIQSFVRDDGTTKNITLIDKTHIHRNRLQVINQYEVEGARANRYDVTVLVNGLPLVHVELKRRGWSVPCRRTPITSDMCRSSRSTASRCGSGSPTSRSSAG